MVSLHEPYYRYIEPPVGLPVDNITLSINRNSSSFNFGKLFFSSHCYGSKGLVKYTTLDFCLYEYVLDDVENYYKESLKSPFQFSVYGSTINKSSKIVLVKLGDIINV